MRVRLAFAIAALGSMLPLAHGDAVSSTAARRALLEAEARNVAVELFRTINERRYDRSCDLLAEGETGRNLCIVGLRVGYLWSQEIRFRVTGVQVGEDRAVVSALADGAPGRVVLARTGGTYRILRVEAR